MLNQTFCPSCRSLVEMGAAVCPTCSADLLGVLRDDDHDVERTSCRACGIEIKRPADLTLNFCPWCGVTSPSDEPALAKGIRGVAVGAELKLLSKAALSPALSQNQPGPTLFPLDALAVSSPAIPLAAPMLAPPQPLPTITCDQGGSGRSLFPTWAARTNALTIPVQRHGRPGDGLRWWMHRLEAAAGLACFTVYQALAFRSGWQAAEDLNAGPAVAIFVLPLVAVGVIWLLGRKSFVKGFAIGFILLTVLMVASTVLLLVGVSEETVNRIRIGMIVAAGPASLYVILRPEKTPAPR